MALDPSFSILYGDLKAGKTADALAAFPFGVYIAAPGALSPAESVWGFPVPKHWDLETFDDVIRFAEQLTAAHFALGMDDATLIADRTAGRLARTGLSGYALWGAVLERAIVLRDTLRGRGLHIVMTSHPRPVHIDNGVRIRGGPSFQGQCATKIPAAADLLLRAESRGGAGGNGDAFGGAAATSTPGWPVMYRTALHPDWLQGSRYNTPDMAPMNLGEILRSAGHAIPRLRGLEWQESIANALANKLLEVGLGNAAKVKEALARVLEYCLGKFTKCEAHAYWALRDGYDRAVLRVASAGQRRRLWGI